jgi:hypothetical protein
MMMNLVTNSLRSGHLGRLTYILFEDFKENLILI